MTLKVNYSFVLLLPIKILQFFAKIKIAENFRACFDFVVSQHSKLDLDKSLLRSFWELFIHPSKVLLTYFSLMTINHSFEEMTIVGKEFLCNQWDSNLLPIN